VIIDRLQPVRRRHGLVALVLELALAACVAGMAPAVASGPARPEPPVATGPQVAVVVTHGGRAAKVVALTFDDGYNPTVCGALVDALVAARVPATFFPNSINVVRAPALWRRVAALGFPIGNHSATHPHMPRLTYVGQWNEIWSDRVALERVIGGPSLSVFRPPYGAYSRGTLLAAYANGYPTILNWDTSFADSSRRRDGRPWPVSSYIRAASRGTNGSVILGHCGSPIDVAALASVIAGYRARGFTFVTVPELLDLPGAAPMVFPSAPSPVAFPTRHGPYLS
jgi:peptidoglycan/xylan/chitin deacetylase (PgdA/CDA1 family)